MSESDRQRWNQRYAEGSYRSRAHPSPLLCEWLAHVPRGRALDLACGAGRNALYLAGQGYDVDAMDISAVALDQARETAAGLGLEINFLEADLDHPDLGVSCYDLVIVARFIDRALIPHIKDALRPGGHVIYDHHLLTTAQVDGPGNPNFRVRPNELLHLFADLRILYYHEALVVETDDRPMALAHLVACREPAPF